MKALRALVSRGMSALAALVTSANVAVPASAPAHHTDRNTHCDCWSCQKMKSNRLRNFVRLRRHSKTFGPPTLTGKRLERVREACAEHHLTVYPRYARNLTGAEIAGLLYAGLGLAEKVEVPCA